MTLRKTDFVPLKFEDVVVEREIDIRGKLGKIFNKFRTDFKSLNDYNNYLEMIEDFVFNLLNKTLVEETQEKILKYKQENKESIQRNNLKNLKESQSLSFKVEREKKEKILRKEAILKELKDSKNYENTLHESLINQLALATDQESLSKALEEYKSKIQNSSNNVDTLDFKQEEEEEDWIIDEISNITRNVLNNYLDPWTAAVKTVDKSLYVKACGYAPRMTYERSVSAAFDNVLLGLE